PRSQRHAPRRGAERARGRAGADAAPVPQRRDDRRGAGAAQGPRAGVARGDARAPPPRVRERERRRAGPYHRAPAPPRRRPPQRLVQEWRAETPGLYRLEYANAIDGVQALTSAIRLPEPAAGASALAAVAALAALRRRRRPESRSDRGA